MKRIRFGLIVGLAITLAGSAIAQPTMPVQPPDDLPPARAAQEHDPELDKPHQWHAIRVRYVEPEMLAWWLDPQHSEEPLEFINTRRMMSGDTGIPASYKTGRERPEAETARVNPRGAFDLPAGVTKVIPVLNRKVLLVFATEIGLQRLEQLIGFLDKPVRTINLQIQAVEVNAAELAILGLQTGLSSEVSAPGLSANGVGPLRNGPTEEIRFGYARADCLDYLAALEIQGEAKTLYTGDLPSIKNNLAAGDSIVRKLTAVEAGGDETGIFKMAADISRDKTITPLSVVNVSSFYLQPTINNDHTVTVMLNISRSQQLVTDRLEERIFLQPVGKTSSIVNIRENSTIAMLGLSRNFFTSDASAPQALAGKGANEPAKTVIFLITVRKISDGTAKFAALPQ